MTYAELKELLDGLCDKYNTFAFIEPDPISVPHLFSEKEDIEIAGFLAATIAWGNRKMIVRNARRMVGLLEGEPARFVREGSRQDFAAVGNFVHRTFNGTDFLFFLEALRRIYREHGGLSAVFERGYARSGDLKTALHDFRTLFFAEEHPVRTERHVSAVAKNSACKRINMFLRWMVRKDTRGVDFGLWKGIPASALYIPLDVHSGGVARELGLLQRRQDDWKAVEELTGRLRLFDPDDPVKYDFALFGVGVNKDF